MVYFRGYGYASNADYDQGNWGYDGGNDEHQNYTQSWDTGLRFNSGVYSSQLVVNYQRIKDYNYSSLTGRYASGYTLDDMEQRYIQWGNNVIGWAWCYQRRSRLETGKTDVFWR
ncbi:vitamin B12/cobalamin outer membrane transporter [Escherichia coli]|uniref:Vitamin B12/cobalamin outer membrane transporter n=1 Tax=Escherichia coli TaxID=562 RepID=A0A377B6R8_ECOLX|nr:vitamin B12/cobalamin outer membrane transporter [Escherichia coli]